MIFSEDVDSDKIKDYINGLDNSSEIQKFEDICCGVKMFVEISNESKNYLCKICGKYIRFSSIDEISEFNIGEENKNIYGKKSGIKYEESIKNDILKSIDKAKKIDIICDKHKYKIIEIYMCLRGAYINRAQPRTGIILGCISKIAGISKEALSKEFQIGTKYITEGIKFITREIPSLQQNTQDDNIDIEYKKFKIDIYKDIFNDNKIIVRELIKLSDAYYIGNNTTIKTKIAAIFIYLSDVKYINITRTDIVKVCFTEINTIYKFYDYLVIYLNASSRIDKLFSENFLNRYIEMRKYFTSRDIPILKIEYKGRFQKYYTVYNFN